MLGERASDAGFSRTLASRQANHERFSTPRRLARAPGEFAIAHYAGSVQYWCGGFVERNLDTLSPEVGQLLASSGEPLLRALFRDFSSGAAPVPTPRRRANTLGSAFKHQLAALMSRISATRTHFVRCINPNVHKQPDAFDGSYVATQLRSAGVLHAVRLARSAYPAR